MKNQDEEHGELQMKPVKRYGAPGYPTYTVASGNPALLEKLPSRWQENAKVIACIGVFGTVALAGCDGNRRDGDAPNTSSPTDIVTNVLGKNHATVRLHHGGQGSSFYVVYLTEMEVLSIIRKEAEAAGFEMSEKPFVKYRAFSGEIEESHSNAFAIYPARDGSRDDVLLSLLRSMRSESVRKAFQESGGDGMQWKDFLKILKA